MKKHINSNYGRRTIGLFTKGCLHSNGKEDITEATSSYVCTDLNNETWNQASQ